jgi:hypothetical protein
VIVGLAEGIQAWRGTGEDSEKGKCVMGDKSQKDKNKSLKQKAAREVKKKEASDSKALIRGGLSLSRSTIVSTPSPLFAAGLSAVMPGLGQLYNREDAKAAAILFSTFGIWAGLVWTTAGPAASRSWLSAAALLLAYFFLLLPAVLDAHRCASGIPESSSSRASRWHVVIMLLAIGPLAIPQLWQSQGFSRRAKILWTCMISVVSLIVILLMVAIGPGLEQWIERSSEPVPVR